MASPFPQRADAVIRFLLLVLLFWIPYSKAVVEICVILALIVWIVKRAWCFSATAPEAKLLQRILLTFRPADTRCDGPIFLFLLFCLLSVLGSAFWDQAWRGFFTKTSKWFVIYFLTVEVMREKKHFTWLFNVFLITTLATVFDCFLQYYFTHHDLFLGRVLVDGRATAGFSHPNGLGAYLCLALSIIMAGLMTPLGPRGLTRTWPVVFILMAWSLVLTFSRGAWGSAIIGIVLFLLLTRKRILKCLWPGMLVLLVLASVIFISVKQDQVRLRINKANVQLTTSWRWALWKDTIKMIREKPVLGHGPNTYMMLSQRYRQEFSPNKRDEQSPTYAHNCYLQLAAEVGILGLVTFLGIFIRFFCSLTSLSSRICRKGDLKIWLAGIAAGILAFLLHSCVDTDFFSLPLAALFWFFMGTSIALQRRLSLDENCDIKITQTLKNF